MVQFLLVDSKIEMKRKETISIKYDFTRFLGILNYLQSPLWFGIVDCLIVDSFCTLTSLSSFEICDRLWESVEFARASG